MKSESRKKDHGEYSVWKNMRRRCNDPTHTSFKRYGGRGIKICKRWDDFYTFLADMGSRPTPQHQLDRENNDLGYTPQNCRWATAQDQARNRSSSRIVSYGGRSMTLAEAADLSGLGHDRVRARLQLGWSVERALSEPGQVQGRISEQQRLAILADARSMREIGEAYGIGITTVWKIKRGSRVRTSEEQP